jgi:uncharacterized membrane protein YccC
VSAADTVLAWLVGWCLGFVGAVVLYGLWRALCDLVWRVRSARYETVTTGLPDAYWRALNRIGREATP